MTKQEIRDGIIDWMSIMDYTEPDELAWIRRNIAALKKQYKKFKKRSNN